MGPLRRESSTRRCAVYGHPEVVATYDERRTRLDDVRTLLVAFEVAVEKGHRFEEGRLVRVGAGLLRVQRGAEGSSRSVVLAEPDYGIPELRFVVGVDATLGHLRAQESIAAILGVTPHFPELHQRVELCTQVDGHSFLVDRAAPLHDDSGICLACADERCASEHDVVQLTLHEILCHFPGVVPFVALPPGATAAVLGGGDAILFHAGREHVLRAGRSTRVPSVMPPRSTDIPVTSGVRAMPGALR